MPPIVHEVLRSPGQPLDAGTRAFMEPRFGHDFSEVRLHTDEKAAESARMVNALAYTVGRDVVFGAGRFAPDTTAGRRLLAHELSHTIQQSQESSGRALMASSLLVSSPDDNYELEAEAQAARVVGGHTTEPTRVQGRTGNAKLQRQADIRQAPPGLESRCVLTEGLGHVPGTNILFTISSSALSASARGNIAAFVRRWVADGSRDDVIVDGWASVDGGQALNWELSCQRAEAVRAELVARGVPRGKITTFAHGESTEFSTTELPENRRAIITRQPGIGPTPTPTPTPVRQLNFRAAAWSFLSCAECNPFTDDGTLGITPPATEPALGSTHRQMHHIEATLGTSDGRTIAPGSARLAGSGIHAGVSHFCGSSGSGHVVSSAAPGSPAFVSSSTGAQGIEFESEMFSRVGATVPPTLPGSPCGFLGTNPLIPVIGNRFKMRLFADGTRESEFVSATLYPSHFLYEDGSLKMFGGAPVHPAQDFFAWASATVPLAVGVVGFKALRSACCHPIASRLACDTVCAGGFSIPGLTFDPISCAAFATVLAGSSCPSPCAPAGASCPPIVRGPNP